MKNLNNIQWRATKERRTVGGRDFITFQVVNADDMQTEIATRCLTPNEHDLEFKTERQFQLLAAAPELVQLVKRGASIKEVNAVLSKSCIVIG